MNGTVIFHDIRTWTTGEPRETQLGLKLQALRAQFAASGARRWCFAWCWDDPFQWFLLPLLRSERPGVSTGRARSRSLTHADLWDMPGRVPLDTWDSWLRLPEQPAAALAQTHPAPAFVPSSGSGEPTPPSGSILGHPSASPSPRIVYTRDQICLAYLRFRGVPTPDQWAKLLPPVIPSTDLFKVFDWQRMAKLLASGA